jgi:hypothetical protein
MADLIDPEMKNQLRQYTRQLANIDQELIDEKQSLQDAIDGIESHSPKLDRLLLDLRETCDMNEIMNSVCSNERTIQNYGLY